jgi:eukaryotic-like serine/threonine-protein kinase
MIGQTVSNYNILEKLGEGGMGIVYKAQDTKLDRVVALKFLPHHIVPGEEEQMRFLQEAKAAATLNHPNVCTIYDIREEGDQQFILMEFVDGVTLRQKMAQSALKAPDVLSYAVQIGEALQEAHSKGIVHRDVKAENIMVNSRNQIKVMDFGLAKLKGTLRITKATSTVGTLAYMAPEQIQGGDVDARSDIFSFGVVLYEMCTGQSPFRGEHEAAIMYSILNEDPAPADHLRPDMPAEVAHILANALEKSPDDRYQTAAEIVRELRRLLKHSTRVVRRPLEGMQSSASIPVSGQTPSPQTSPVSVAAETQTVALPGKRGLPLWGKVAAGVALLAIVASGVWQLMKPSYEISKDMVFKPLSIPFSSIWYPGLSSDGNWIAFPATDDQGVTEIYYMNASGGEPRRLTNDSLFKYTASISPDGSQIVYSRGASRQVAFNNLSLWTVSTLGGEPKRIAENGNDGIFSPDGKYIGYLTSTQTAGALCIIDADGANKRVIATEANAGSGSRESFAWSPDGSALVFIRNIVSGGTIVQEVVTKEIRSGKETELTHDRKNIDEVWWTTNGLILFSSNRGGATNLWAIPATGGTPTQITKGPGPDIAVRASRDGKRVLYLQQAEFGSIQIGSSDGSTTHEITPADQSVRGPKFSPDGKNIAYIVTDSDPIKPGSSIFVMNREGQNRRRVLQLNTLATYLFWSPDGRKIAYRHRDSVWHAGVVNVESSGQSTDMGQGVVQQWVDGGAALNIVKENACWRVPLDGSAPSRISEDSTVIIFSPAGPSKFLVDRRKGAVRLILQKSDGTEKTLREGNFGGARWSPDGSEIMVFQGDGTILFFGPDGKSRRYVWKDPSTLYPDDLSRDLKTSVSVRNRTQSKLILIDGFM